MVADIEELGEMNVSEIHAKRLDAKEVLAPMSGEKITVPIADGKAKLSGGDQVLRTSTLIRDSPDRGGETRKIFEENQTGSPPQDSSPVKQEMISGEGERRRRGG